jgi:hypothetical protein
MQMINARNKTIKTSSFAFCDVLYIILNKSNPEPVNNPIILQRKPTSLTTFYALNIHFLLFIYWLVK